MLSLITSFSTYNNFCTSDRHSFKHMEDGIRNSNIEQIQNSSKTAINHRITKAYIAKSIMNSNM
jgi:hypothetical protein